MKDKTSIFKHSGAGTGFYCSSDRFLLYIRTECRFLEVFWDLPGRRSVTLALDGSCKLEKTSGGD